MNFFMSIFEYWNSDGSKFVELYGCTKVELKMIYYLVRQTFSIHSGKSRLIAKIKMLDHLQNPIFYSSE